MSLRKYFKPVNALPTPKESGLSMHATTEANKAVEKALWRETEAESTGRKRKYTSTFTPEERAAIWKYAAENGNAKADCRYFPIQFLVVATSAVVSKSKSALLIPVCTCIFIFKSTLLIPVCTCIFIFKSALLIPVCTCIFIFKSTLLIPVCTCIFIFKSAFF